MAYLINPFETSEKSSEIKKWVFIAKIILIQFLILKCIHLFKYKEEMFAWDFNHMKKQIFSK